MVEAVLERPRSRWVPVEYGPLPRLLVLRGELEANAIPADIPDESIGIWDPFIRGGNIFEYELRVPASCAATARELVAAWKPELCGAAERGEFGAAADAEGERAPPDSDLARLQRRARIMWWSVLTGLFAPLCLVLAPGYLAHPLRGALTRRERWMSASAIAFAVAQLILLAIGAWVYATMLREALAGAP